MTDCRIDIVVKSQRLFLYSGAELLYNFPISTAAKGLGEQMHSEKTPRGRHIIRAKIGTGCPIYTVFKARRPTGEIYSPELKQLYPERDWILTRILWLQGQEPGKNRFGSVDTMRRYIYIHGCPDETDFSQPSSHGCIRMRNADILTLFDHTPLSTPVWIG